jgi:UDP-N-acetylmuramate: L-alanyl-gamma-D-glutamyl-meso-diaminopimelate ligase
MHIHILGICGTFMGSLALLAKQAGHQVSGSDANVYPPMSTQLEESGIRLIEGFDPQQLCPAPDLVVVGNAMSRGNPCVEYMLDNRLAYISGPQWLGENILRDKHVFAVSGTHGKTTTSSMLAKILDFAGLQPGFLIGGIPQDFGISARLSDSDYFVVEADEYDSAFFDKRSKFVHYFTNTLIINNLEFDHADIFDDLAAIQRQFHHLVRTVPSTGAVISPSVDANVTAVLDQGCWSSQEVSRGMVKWVHSGLHNVMNGLSAVIAAHQVGVKVEQACAALSEFVGVKRRMEVIYQGPGITVYDDFAHHPTAIKTTLEGLRAKVGNETIIAIIEPRSATMRMGAHQVALSASVGSADQVYWYQNAAVDWDLGALAKASLVCSQSTDSIEVLLKLALKPVAPNRHIVVMSNGGFEGFHAKLTAALSS